MNKFWKKGIALVLTGTLVLGCSTSVFAEGEDQTDTTQTTETTTDAEVVPQTTEPTQEGTSGDAATTDTSAAATTDATAADTTTPQTQDVQSVVDATMTDSNTDQEVVVDSDDKAFVSLGADLSATERATVLSLMGITEDQLANYTVVTVTNAEEHQYLDSYIDSATIGTRALSSVLVMEGEKNSGIQVTTKNINYCTSGMYQNALATAGVKDAQVIVAGPSSISGTAALIGAIEAYSAMTGEEIQGEVIDGAIDEIVTTGQIEAETGASDEVEGMIAYLKQIVAESENMSDDEIMDEIHSAEQQYNVSLSADQEQELLDLLRKLSTLDLDWDNIAVQAQKVYDRLQKLGFNLDDVDTQKLAANAGTIFDRLMAWIKKILGL